MYLGLLFMGLVFFSASSLVQAFSFTYGTPAQCDNLAVSWTGTYTKNRVVALAGQFIP
jgi:hypothetical protein